jgi:hypothetical protein
VLPKAAAGVTSQRSAAPAASGTLGFASGASSAPTAVEAEVLSRASASTANAHLTAKLMAVLQALEDAKDDKTPTFPDNAPGPADDDDEQLKDWNNFEALKCSLNAIGIHKQCGDATINTKTTPCVVNDPYGRLHFVIQKRLRDAFSIDVSLCRRIVQKAFDILTWYQDNVMPPSCQLIRSLQENKDCPRIMAEEIAAMVVYDGLITNNPNQDWTTGRKSTHRDGEDLPCAVTVVMYTVPISRKEAIRWLGNKERGADFRADVEPKTVVFTATGATLMVEDGPCVMHFSNTSTATDLGKQRETCGQPQLREAQAGVNIARITRAPYPQGMSGIGTLIWAI